MFDNRREIATRNTAAPVKLLLDVRGFDREHIAVPRARGKTHERVCGVVGRMRTSVHPDGPVLHVRPDVDLVRDDFLRCGILLFPDSELQRSSINVRKVVGFALMFEKIDSAHVVSVGVASSRLVDGNTGEVALHVTGDSIAVILSLIHISEPTRLLSISY